jgi:hypothetical protein
LQDFYAIGYITSPGHCRLPIADFRLAFELEGISLPIKSEIGNRKSAMIWWLWVESNHQPFAYETKALPFELHSHFLVESSSFSLLLLVQDNLKIEL